MLADYCDPSAYPGMQTAVVGHYCKHYSSEVDMEVPYTVHHSQAFLLGSWVPRVPRGNSFRE